MILNAIELVSIFVFLFYGSPTLINAVRGNRIDWRAFFKVSLAATAFIACRFYFR